MPQHRGGVRPDQASQHPVPVRPRQPRQLTPQRQPSARTCRRRRPGPPGGPARATAGAAPRPGAPSRAASSRAGTSSASSRASAASSSARPCATDSSAHPAAADPGQVPGAQVPGHRAGLLPQAPGQRHPGQARRPPGRGQPVQERVARRVVPLPGVTQRRRGRGEQHEHLQIGIPGELVQMPRRIGLGPHHRIDPRRGQRPGHPVIQHPRRVHHPGQRRIGRDPGQQPGQRAPVGHVAGGDLHHRAAPGQARGQGGGTGRGRAGPAGQHQGAGPAAAARCPATTAPSIPVPPVISTVPGSRGAAGSGGMVSTSLPAWRAWLMNRNASAARRTSQARTGGGSRIPAASSAVTLPQDLPEPVRTRLTGLERPVPDTRVVLARPAPGRAGRSCPSR